MYNKYEKKNCNCGEKSKWLSYNLHGLRKYCTHDFPFLTSDFDSVSMYELVSKCICYLKEIGKNVVELEEAFIALQDFVTNFFDNLDVQEEINNKLDEMYRDGTLTQIIDDIFETLRNEMSDLSVRTQAQLDEHTTQIAQTPWRNSNYRNRITRNDTIWNEDGFFTFGFPYIYVDCVNGTDGIATPDWDYKDGVLDIPPVGRKGFKGSYDMPFKTIDSAITIAGRYFNDVRIILKTNGVYKFNVGFALTLNALHIYQGDAGNDISINNGTDSTHPQCKPNDVTIQTNNFRAYMPHIRITGQHDNRLILKTENADSEVIYCEGGNLYLWNVDVQGRLQALNGSLTVINCVLHGVSGYTSNIMFGSTSARADNEIANIYKEGIRSSQTSIPYYFVGCNIAFHANNPMRIWHDDDYVETGRDNWQFSGCQVSFRARCGNYRTGENQKFFRLIFRACSIQADEDFTDNYRKCWVGSYAENCVSNINNWDNNRDLPT